jgi:hypothetical protein
MSNPARPHAKPWTAILGAVLKGKKREEKFSVVFPA